MDLKENPLDREQLPYTETGGCTSDEDCRRCAKNVVRMFNELAEKQAATSAARAKKKAAEAARLARRAAEAKQREKAAQKAARTAAYHARLEAENVAKLADSVEDVAGEATVANAGSTITHPPLAGGSADVNAQKIVKVGLLLIFLTIVFMLAVEHNDTQQYFQAWFNIESGPTTNSKGPHPGGLEAAPGTLWRSSFRAARLRENDDCAGSCKRGWMLLQFVLSRTLAH